MSLHRCSRIYGEACGQGIESRIREDMGRVKVEFLAPDKSCLLALLDDSLEKAAENGQTIAGADARQAGMVGQGLVKVVAQIPPHTEPVGDQAHEVAFGADALEKHHQLQLEEDHRINGGASHPGHIAVLHQIPHKGKIKHTVEVAIEVIRRDHSRRTAPAPANRAALFCPS